MGYGWLLAICKHAILSEKATRGKNAIVFGAVPSAILAQEQVTACHVVHRRNTWA